MAWHDDHVWAVTTLITAITTQEAVGATIIDRYHSSGTAVEQVGWKILEIGAEQNPPPPAVAKEESPAKAKTASKRKPKTAAAENSTEDDTEQSLPSGLTVGQAQQMLEARAVAKQTRPPAAPDRGDLVDRDGDRRATVGRQGTVGGDEGQRSRHGGDPRRHHRNPA